VVCHVKPKKGEEHIASVSQGFRWQYVVECLIGVSGEQLFLYLPLEHSEALADQHDCVDLIGRLDANPKWRPAAQQHRDIIARFGRFPHRNAALGRETTAEEAAFLTEPDSSF
jgi:uncharacterized protein (DUF924 family)